MAWDTFTKIVDQMLEFDTKIKAIHFQGMGEPLINKKLPKMIAYIKERGIAEKLNLITNGALLTERYSLDLIASGIDTIKISLQGLTAEKYHETCGVTLDIKKLIDNITFLYHHKQDCELFIKVVDLSLGVGEDELFFSLFNQISDRANIEHIRQMFSGVDYQRCSVDKNGNANMYAQTHPTYEVCSLGFFMMYINPEGDVYPCCNQIDPAQWGNIYQNTLTEIWEGKSRQEFLEMMLRKERNNQDKYPICKNCNIPDAVLRIEDNLDTL